MDKENGWRSEGAAETYRKVVDFIVPGRREMLEIIASVAAGAGRDGLRVLDIGSGHGDVAAEILRVNETAVCTLVDFSDEMVASGKERFRANPRVTVLRHDLDEGLPDAVMGQKFDAAVSCLCIHHIGLGNRVRLYRDIYGVLEDGRFFVNGDMFKCDSPALSEWEFDRWIEWMVASRKTHLGIDETFEETKKKQLESFERMGDMPGTLREMASDLRAAGFAHVDCLYKTMNLAVVAAQK